MSGDETLQKERLEESDSEEEEEIEASIPKVEIDPSKLTPLSPEVISKQVCYLSSRNLHFGLTNGVRRLQ